ncbi:hypothetical protein NQZ68_009203 [Dissostichus eleginoides]|nr:hypothetical protein NQZ68_009203 [Dissostichus eleginoides]
MLTCPISKITVQFSIQQAMSVLLRFPQPAAFSVSRQHQRAKLSRDRLLSVSGHFLQAGAHSEVATIASMQDRAADFRQHSDITASNSGSHTLVNYYTDVQRLDVFLPRCADCCGRMLLTVQSQRQQSEVCQPVQLITPPLSHSGQRLFAGEPKRGMARSSTRRVQHMQRFKESSADRNANSTKTSPPTSRSHQRGYKERCQLGFMELETLEPRIRTERCSGGRGLSLCNTHVPTDVTS